MKSLLRRWNTGETTHEDFSMGSTMVVILLLLLFIGTSFYLMITNY